MPHLPHFRSLLRQSLGVSLGQLEELDSVAVDSEAEEDVESSNYAVSQKLKILIGT